ncbi:fasciclin domain-containing protein [Aureibaculum sp. A20]|uniref:Fasciclin domain-containing protein n=1 Tax=Aureibaculum flavum TaxID=2795986 RepID=A0ABS0WNJ2_9FLAO|nr:glycan-binding surface protein [Aureibaculum flavum]MBJ2173552.1 fasciclin domain-containing protein [Aureibaculum flavum]
MKASKLKYSFLFIVISFALLTSCKDEDDLFPQISKSVKNITEIASQNPELSTFLSALKQTGLDSTFSTATTFTVFAPKNDAFTGLNLTNLSNDSLQNILLNHVLSTVTPDFTANMTTGYLTSMATGPDGNNLSFFTDNSDGLKFNGMASLASGMYDIGATNGIVHVVDALLTPPTVLDHVKANPEFSMLAEAIEKSDIKDVLDAKDSLFTLFAPSNAAFEKFMMDANGAFGWTSLDDIPMDVLNQVLLYHIVSGENILSSLIDGTAQTSMQGESFDISGTSINDASYTDATINLTDVQGVNGVMHGVDKVLLTEDVFQSILSATLNMVERCEDRGFSTFLAAIEKAGMTTMLATDDLTAFAPNNDGFNALFILTENFESLDDFDTPEELAVLKDLLNYQLYAGQLSAGDLTDGGSVTTLFGDTFKVDLSGDNPRLKPSFTDAIPSGLVTPNIGSSNGIIHEINRVLIPQALLGALGIVVDQGCNGPHPVGDPNLVFFDWDANGPWWGAVAAENDAALSLDGSSYGRANFTTSGGGWNDMYWRNDGSTFNGASTVGTNLNDYVLKFDIRTIEPISAGAFKFRFRSDANDAFYDWKPWSDTGEALDTEGGWITIEIPLSALGQPDFSAVNQEFGMAFEDGGAAILLNFAIDNVRFDAPDYSCGGPDPVSDSNLVFYDWDANGAWWGAAAAENDASISLDGSSYGRVNLTTGGGGWNDMFWRNDASTFNGASTVGTNINDYVLKFDLYTIEPIAAGTFRFRFHSDATDAIYDWQPWVDTGEALDTGGQWVTYTIPLSVIGQPDFGAVNQEFGLAIEDNGNPLLLNFAIDNVRFEAN